MTEGSSLQRGQSVVYGTFEFQSALPGGTPFFSEQSFVIRVVENKTLQNVLQHPVKGHGGEFYWNLPPGGYAILDLYSQKMGFVEGLTGRVPYTSLRIYSEFSVPEEGKLIYLGKLTLTDVSGSVRMSVADDSESAKAKLHAAFPKVEGEHLKQVVKPEVRR